MLINDKNEFNNFVKLLPDISKDEVYFISLSARNKYLTKEEREFYSLGRTEMFGRTLIKNKLDFEYAMNKLESTLNYKHTNNGKKVPEKALVVYININPSSMTKAYFLFQKEMNQYTSEILNAYNNNKEPNYTGILHADRKLMNAIQKSQINKYFLDIDIDCYDEVRLLTIVEFLITRLKEYNVTHYTIETKSGYHVLIEKDSLNVQSKKHKDFKLHKMIEDLNNYAEEYDGEVMFNSNAMVPVPGTLQAGKLVRLVSTTTP